MPDSVDGVVLAAGLSTRSKRYKMALPLGDRTVIEQSIAGMVDVVRRIYVVVGWKAECVKALLAGYDKVTPVYNAHFREGMFSSVRAGMACVRADRFFLLPGDCALVGAAVYSQMLAVSGSIVIPTYKGRKGHPVLFDRTVVSEILDMPGDATLRDYVNVKGYTAIEVDDEGILLDIDTPDDYDVMRARVRRRGGVKTQEREE
ncbi:MAG: nucleotidyltransferase family protein [Anaerolineae bacterium]|nr:nucleotidyltransferase family protein [Anaerolineae bacterium]